MVADSPILSDAELEALLGQCGYAFNLAVRETAKDELRSKFRALAAELEAARAELDSLETRYSRLASKWESRGDRLAAAREALALAERACVALVLAAGGEVRVPARILREIGPDATLSRTFDITDDSDVFRAALAGQAAARKTCTPDACAYGNFWCPNGCAEIVALDEPPAGGQAAAEPACGITRADPAWRQMVRRADAVYCAPALPVDEPACTCPIRQDGPDSGYRRRVPDCPKHGDVLTEGVAVGAKPRGDGVASDSPRQTSGSRDSTSAGDGLESSPAGSPSVSASALPVAEPAELPRIGRHQAQSTPEQRAEWNAQLRDAAQSGELPGCAPSEPGDVPAGPAAEQRLNPKRAQLARHFAERLGVLLAAFGRVGHNGTPETDRAWRDVQDLYMQALERVDELTALAAASAPGTAAPVPPTEGDAH